MSKEPKVSKEERESQTEHLYAKVGKIAVLGEHLNFALFECSHKVLEVKGLPQNYAQTVLGKTVCPRVARWLALHCASEGCSGRPSRSSPQEDEPWGMLSIFS